MNHVNPSPKALLAGFGLAAAVCSVSLGQAPPVNDDCAGALPITMGEGVTFDTTNATTSPQPVNEAQCAGTFLGWGTANKDVWFRWTATSSMNIIVNTCDPSSFDTSLVVYQGSSCDTLVQVACNGDGPEETACQVDADGVSVYSQVTNLWVTAGETYYFRVGGYTTAGVAASGPGSLFLFEGFVYECVAPAFPNDCAPNAQVVTADGNFLVAGTTATNVQANTDGPEHLGTLCQSGNDQFFLDRWYRFTPTATGIFKAFTTAPDGSCTGALDMKLALYDLGTTPASFNYSQLPGALVACNDDGGPCAAAPQYGSQVETLVRPGRTYLLRVGWFDSSLAANGVQQRLSITLPAPCQLQSGTVAEAEPCGENTDGGCNTSAEFPEVQQIAIGDVVSGTFWSGVSDQGTATRDTDWYQFSVTSEVNLTAEVRSRTPCTVFIANAQCGTLLQILGTSSGFCPSATTNCLVPGVYRAIVVPEFSPSVPCGTGIENEYRLSFSTTPAQCPIIIATSCTSPGPNSVTINNSQAAGNGLVACAVGGAAGGTTANQYARVFAAGTYGGEISCLNVGVFAVRTTAAGLVASDRLLPMKIGMYKDLDGGAPRFISNDGGTDGGDLIPIVERDVLVPGGAYKGTLNFPSPVCVEEYEAFNLVVVAQFPNIYAGFGDIPPASGYGIRAGGNTAGPVQNTYCRLSCADAAGQFVLTETIGATFTAQWVVELNGNFSGCQGNACPADLNDDNFVNGDDLGILLGAWGQCASSTCPADFNQDGFVNGDDLGVMLGAWGACPAG